MSPAVRKNSFRVVLSCILTFAAAGAFAQTSVDDVHVTPREIMPRESSVVATAAYPNAGRGPYAGGGLIRTSADLVLVPVTITDAQHNPIVGLDQTNFQLFEGKKPQEIKNFSNEDAPVSVGILVDTSSSMGFKLARVREAVVQFCEAANPQDEFFMITFSDTPQLTTDFTARPENIENDLLTSRPKGQTSLLDAIYMGLQKMRSARYARKALLILSDGGDNHSRYTEGDVKAAIRESDVTIYAVGAYEHYVSTQEELLGPELLRTVTGLTGGHAFTLTNDRDMAAATRNIGTQLRHQYVLAYQPQAAPRNGKWHKISVKLRLPKSFHFVHVEARPGYYAAGE